MSESSAKLESDDSRCIPAVSRSLDRGLISATMAILTRRFVVVPDPGTGLKTLPRRLVSRTAAHIAPVRIEQQTQSSVKGPVRSTVPLR